MRQLLTLLTTVALLGLSPTTHAAGEPPTDAALLGAKTVGVLPVFTTGLSRADSYASLGVFATLGIDAKPQGRGAALVKLQGDDGGFAFAGTSSTADVRILQYAFIAGSLASDADDPELYRQALAFLAAQRETLASLSPKLVKAFDGYLSAAQAGRLDGAALAQAMSAAEEGISTGPARAHGYFATGLWLGLSFIAAAVNEPNPDYYGVAVPLATLLEEDAGFGGSDRALAKEVRAIGELLAKASPDLETLKRHLGAALAIQADDAPAAAE